MSKVWKWIILGATYTVLGLFTWVAWDASVTAGWIMTGADVLVTAGLLYFGLKKRT